MSNTTSEYWEVDGVSLQTFAFDIETIGGDRLAPPVLRGDNLIIPSQRGRMFTPKTVDSRVITLGMWVIGTNEDGSAPTGSTYRKWDDNWRKLRQLLWTPNREITLTKRFYVNGVLKTASAKAQFSSGLAPKMDGRARGTFTVDLFLTDPYFYGPDIVTNLTTGNNTLTVEGDDYTDNIKIHVNGPRKNPKIRNTTMNHEISYAGDLSSGDVLDVDVKAYTSITDPAATLPYSSVGSIRHTGHVAWLALQPGNNVVNVSSDTGSGGITLTRKEAWL